MADLVNIAWNIVGPIFLVIGVAVVIGRRFNPDPRTLSVLLVYVLIPCLIFDGIEKSDLQAGEIGQIAALVVLFTIIIGLLSWAVSRVFCFDRRLESTFILTVIMMNAANYGIPLNELAFKAEGSQRAVVYYVLTALVANNVGIYLVSRGRNSARQALLNVFKVPILYAAVLGFALNIGHLRLPAPVDQAIVYLRGAAIPGMLILLGFQLARASVRGRLKPIILGTGLRLLVAPVLAVLLAALLGMTGVTRQVSIVQSSMPTAVLASAISAEFGGDNDYTSAVTLFTTLASIVTLTVLIYLLKM